MTNMRPRRELVDLFSSFVQLEADRFHRWLIDARLQRNMHRCLQVNANDESYASESRWALYWYRRWAKEDGSTALLPLGHLSAYLQEPCYWAAHQMIGKFTSSQYGLSDYFQIAIAEMPTVLKRFQCDRGANLKTFASIAFPSLLKDHLRQRQEMHLCTPMGLLRRVSKKRFLEALRQAGLSTSAIAQYRLAWMCFNALYVQPQTGTQQLPPLDRPLWSAIADLYNRERCSQFDSLAADCTPEMMERWLNQCATWVRSYLYPAIASLNVPRAGTESGNEIQDTLSEPLQESLLSELVTQEELQERQQQQFQIREQTVAALSNLEVQSQELLRLYYQEGLTQQQIMQSLNMSQATVSRRLTKAREAVLWALVQWSQQTLNSSPDPNLIKDMSAALEEWLGVYYGGLNPVSGSERMGKDVKS